MAQESELNITNGCLFRVTRYPTEQTNPPKFFTYHSMASFRPFPMRWGIAQQGTGLADIR